MHIRKMIADPLRIIGLLDTAMATVEAPAQWDDEADISYRTRAQAMADRRANLKRRIASLEERLQDHAGCVASSTIRRLSASLKRRR
jgi:hypothetical protein